MSSFSENARSPMVIGVVLGLVVLVAFGGLGMAVFDGRFNGDNASRLKDEIIEQSVEIESLENKIESIEEEIIAQKRNEEVALKLDTVVKTLEVLEEKESALEKQIDDIQKEIVHIDEEQVAYRDEYRVYERNRALGEKVASVTLQSGKELKDVTIKEIMTDRVRFTTEFGSTTATWDELPESWKERFQIGEGELVKHAAMMKEAQLKTSLAQAASSAEHGNQLRIMELKRSVDKTSKELEQKKNDVERGRARMASLKRQASELRSKHREALARDRKSSHLLSANKIEGEIDRVDRAVRATSDAIKDLQKQKGQYERELRQAQR